MSGIKVCNHCWVEAPYKLQGEQITRPRICKECGVEGAVLSNDSNGKYIKINQDQLTKNMFSFKK